MILSKAPYRLTFGGGGTDLPAFYKKHGGFVISMAIDKGIFVSLKPDSLEDEIKVRYSKTEIVDNIKELEHDRAREALILHGIKDSIEISSCGDVPSNTGLGSSGTYLVSLLNAIRKYKKLSCEPRVLAEESCKIEMDLLGLPVGKQDQYISSFGGFKILRIEKDGSVEVEDVAIDFCDILTLLKNVQVYYLRKRRDANELLFKQNSSKKSVEDKMLKVKEMGYHSLDHIESGNFDKYGLLLDEYWNLKKKFSKKMSTTFIDNIYAELKTRFKILGGKIIGAGGGGFMMIYTNKRHDKIQQFMEKNGLIRLNFLPDYNGATILGNFTSSNLVPVH